MRDFAYWSIVNGEYVVNCQESQNEHCAEEWDDCAEKHAESTTQKYYCGVAGFAA